MKNHAICTQNTIVVKQIISITVVWEQVVFFLFGLREQAVVACKVLIEVTYHNQGCLWLLKTNFPS